MYEPLIIPEHTDWMACTRVWDSHIELQAASSFFEMPVFLCNTSQSGHQTIHTREISSLRLSFCKKKILGTRL